MLVILIVYTSYEWKFDLSVATVSVLPLIYWFNDLIILSCFLY
jgi:hypothetical protein